MLQIRLLKELCPKTPSNGQNYKHVMFIHVE